MRSFVTAKYRFRIRTRQGSVVDKLMIPGRTEAEAEHKLRQMYPYCEVLECASHPSGAIPRMLALHGDASIFPGK